MLTSLVALLFTMVALALYDRATFRRTVQADANVLAGVIGENASSSIAFNDRQTAESTLAALRTQPHVVSAHLFDRSGRPRIFEQVAGGTNGGGEDLIAHCP